MSEKKIKERGRGGEADALSHEVSLSQSPVDHEVLGQERGGDHSAALENAENAEQDQRQPVTPKGKGEDKDDARCASIPASLPASSPRPQSGSPSCPPSTLEEP